MGASRLLVTLVLLTMIGTEAVANESAKLLILGAVVGYWLGHGGEADGGGGLGDQPAAATPQSHRTTDRKTTTQQSGDAT